MGKVAAGALLLLGIAIVLSLATPEAAERRVLQNAHERRMLALQYQQDRNWQERQQPVINMALTSLGIVALAGATGGAVVAFAALGLAVLNWARGLDFEKRYVMRELASKERVLMAAHQYQHALPPSHLHYAPHISTSSTHAPAAVIDQGEAPPGMPGLVDLAALDFSPSAGRLLLGLGPGGEMLTVSGRQLMHVALAGATGSGKTNTARLVVSQVLAVGGRVVVANPHWCSYDAESGDDWTAIERRLHLAPAIKPDDIGDLLRWLVDDEMERRLERKRAGELPGEGLMLYVDELPVIVQEVPDAARLLGKLLRQGRALRLYLCGASQDFLTRTIGSSSGIREAYRTVFYSGGDLTGARSLLDIRQSDIEEHQLGQGVVYLRSAATSPARLVRVPLASNQGISRMLGAPAQAHVVSGADVAAGASPSGTTTGAAATPAAMEKAALSVQAERVRSAILEGLSQNEIIRRVWGCEPNTRQGKRAVDEYRAILAEIARAAV